jgi:hypothetical protein
MIFGEAENTGKEVVVAYFKAVSPAAGRRS